jgi:hypothetical protein
MADYPILAATLAALNGTKSDPAGTEDCAKIDDCLRQTRTWMYDFLSVPFNSDGTLKATAFGDSSAFPAGCIRGTNPVGGAQREILQASILAADLATDAVETAKIKDLNVTTAKINDLAVTTGKLADSAVTAAKIADGTITAAKLASLSIAAGLLATDSVTTAKIADNNVTSAKIPAAGIAGDRLVSGTVGQILVGGNTVNGQANSFAPKTASGAVTVDADGVFSFSLGGQSTAYAVVAEVANRNTNGGTGNNGVGIRGSGADGLNNWTLVDGSSSLVSVLPSDGHIYIKQDGVYLVSISAPAHGVDGHKISVDVQPDATDTLTVNTRHGSSEFSAAGVTSRSHCQFLMTIINTTDVNFASVYIRHIRQNAAATAAHSFGRPANLDSNGSTAGGDDLSEIFAIVSVLKLL